MEKSKGKKAAAPKVRRSPRVFVVDRALGYTATTRYAVEVPPSIAREMETTPNNDIANHINDVLEGAYFGSPSDDPLREVTEVVYEGLTYRVMLVSDEMEQMDDSFEVEMVGVEPQAEFPKPDPSARDVLLSVASTRHLIQELARRAQAGVEEGLRESDDVMREFSRKMSKISAGRDLDTILAFRTASSPEEVLKIALGLFVPAPVSAGK